MCNTTKPLTALVFKERIIRVDLEQKHHFEISFANGGIISCPSKEEALLMAEKHLKRAKKHGYFDQILCAEKIIYKRRKRPKG
jgi:hypothetical protein